MSNLLEKLRRVPLGGWVLIALALSTVSSVALKANSDGVRAALLALREPRLAEGAQAILWRGEAVPQAFNVAKNVAEARALLAEILRANRLPEARAFHRLDLSFMAGYGLLLVLGAFWARKRARVLAASPGGFLCRGFAQLVSWLWPLAVVAAVVGVAGDLAEYFACTKMLGGSMDAHQLEQTLGAHISEDLVKQAVHASAVKWWGVSVSAATGLLAGLVAGLLTPGVRTELRAIWGLVVRAHHFAMKARFSVLGGALLTVLLLTGPGEDIVRSVATGTFHFESAPKSPPQPDFALLGWFAVALLVLAGTCWGWARLVLAVRFTAPEQGPAAADADVEGRLRRALPIYYGAVPLVAGACAFALAPLQEDSAAKFPIAQFFAASLAPVLLFFLLPLALVILRASAKTARTSVGPLSWILLGYGALAVVHAWLNWNDLHVLGLVPVVLIGAALFVFGLGRPGGVLLLPAILLVTAAMHGKLSAAWPPALLLCGLGAFAFWSAGRIRCSEALHIPMKFRTRDLLRVIFGNAARSELREKIRGDERVHLELQRQRGASEQDGKKDGEPPDELSAEAVDRLRGLLRLCAVLVLVQAALFAVVTLVPGFSARIGSGAVLALGLGGWATAGSLLLFLTQSTRFPILGASLVVAVGCSGLMDNHQMRLFGKAEPAFVQERMKPPVVSLTGDPSPVGDAFDKWQRLAVAKSGAKEPPCIIIAAEGGGIRAALWPALVLGTLQDLSLERRKGRPDFASHVFAISGVSGGSIGAAVFTALCADQRDTGKLRERAAAICGKDHLAPPLGALLYPDFAQRFLPVSVFGDRAAAFEHSWEKAWPDEYGANRLAAPFTRLWNDADDRWLPALLLNATMVETGQRAIFSSIPIRTGAGGQFIDAHDLHAHLRASGPGAGDWNDVPLSTAAHASARFPIISPPGRLPSGARVVDGGYFENSGATTALDILNGVTRRLDQTHDATKIIVIFLRHADGPGLTDEPPRPLRPAGPPLPEDDAVLYPQKNVLNETGGILGTVLATRSARGSYALDAIFNRYLARENIKVLSFTFRGERIPLSWSLSQRSCNEMLSQFPTSLKTPEARDADEATRRIIGSNNAVAEWLLNELYGP